MPKLRKKTARIVLAGVSPILLGLAWYGYRVHAEMDRRAHDVACLRDVGHSLIKGYAAYHEGLMPGSSWEVAEQPTEWGPRTQQRDVTPPQKGYGWIVELMPYHEFVSAYSQVDFRKPWDDPVNAKFAAMRIKEGSTDPKGFGFVWEEDPAAPTGSPFVGVAGVGVDAAQLPTSDPRAGVFGFGRRTNLADIKDGASTTMAVITTSTPSGHWLAGDSGSVRGLDPSRQPYLGDAAQFGRAGGAPALFADGSIRWVRDSIAPKVFEAIATTHGGEPVPEDDFGPRIGP